jgi:hypothetical protein
MHYLKKWGFEFEAGVLNEESSIMAVQAVKAKSLSNESLIAMFRIKTFNMK